MIIFEMLLKNKTAVITGCNKGIGKEILRLFSENGANIFACSRNLTDEFNNLIKQTEKDFNNKIIPVKIDLADENSVKEASKRILSEGKDIDILINNAGSIQTSLFQMTSIKKMKELFEINFFSQTVFTQFMIKSMIKNKCGSIVNISSNSAIDGNEGRSSYVSTKAALISQGRVLSRELGPSNIRVNTIAPGLTNTDMMTQNTTKQIIDEIASKTPLRKIAEPKDIANVALFLSSALSSHITGQTIRVDGGI
tara:strand:+ start:2563 stop:3321 length:759 start_codon:yes stop_codon:yes gene_type:complete